MDQATHLSYFNNLEIIFTMDLQVVPMFNLLRDGLEELEKMFVEGISLMPSKWLNHSCPNKRGSR